MIGLDNNERPFQIKDFYMVLKFSKFFRFIVIFLHLSLCTVYHERASHNTHTQTEVYTYHTKHIKKK